MSHASIQVRAFTSKGGALSAVGHALELDVPLEKYPELELRALETVDSTAFEVQIDSSKIHVLHAVTNASERHPLPSALSESDCKKINASLREDVLDAVKFPHIIFRGTATALHAEVAIVGDLTLHGRTQALRFRLGAAPKTTADSVANNLLLAEFTLRTSDFGIRPFSALFGALRVDDDVRIAIRVTPLPT